MSSVWWLATRNRVKAIYCFMPGPTCTRREEANGGGGRTAQLSDSQISWPPTLDICRRAVWAVWTGPLRLQLAFRVRYRPSTAGEVQVCVFWFCLFVCVCCLWVGFVFVVFFLLFL